MILSRPYQFIFLATPKCASRALAQLFRKHYSAVAVNAGNTASAHHDNTVPEYYLNDYLLISVRRNPYSRLVSMYLYIRRTAEHRYYLDVVKMEFDEFVPYWIAQTTNTDIPDEMSQVDFIYGKDRERKGKVVTLRFETLERDLHRLTLPSIHAITLPKVNYHGEYDWRHYYTPDIQEQVYDFYREDFEAFGYTEVIE